MLKQYIIAIEHGEPAKPMIITKNQSDPLKYEPVTDFDDKEQAEKALAYIQKIGVDAYLAEVLNGLDDSRFKKGES